jgi:hypothetical protein
MSGGNFDRSDLLPYKKIYDNLSSYINDEISAIHGEEHDLFDIIYKNWDIISKPNNIIIDQNNNEIFNIKPKYSADEIKVKENKHEPNSDAAAWLSALRGDLPIIHREAILNMSNKMQLNEIECLRFWIAAADEGNRLLVDVKNDTSKNLLELISVAAPRLVRFEHTCLLNVLFLLMENRNNNNNLSEHKYKKLMAVSNKLLEGEISLHILDSIKKCIYNLKPNSVLVKTEEFDDIKHLRILSDTFFFMFYDTQANINEAKKLCSICQDMERLLVESTSGRNPTNDSWTIQCHKSLVSLQLTLIYIWQQDQVLLDRTCNEFPFQSSNKGNTLDCEQMISKDDEYLNGFEGFLYLINAFSHTEKDFNDILCKDKIRQLLRNASEKRAFTYIRLCLLPVLRSSYSNNDVMESLHIAALNKLLQGVILLSGRYIDGITKPSVNNHYLILSSDAGPKSAVDYLDDVIILYSEMCSAHPNFSQLFLHSSTAKNFLFDIVDSLQKQKDICNSLFLFFKFLDCIANSLNTLHTTGGMPVEVEEVYYNIMKKIKVTPKNVSIDVFCMKYLNGFEHKTMLSKKDEITLPYLAKAVDLLASVAQGERVTKDLLEEDKKKQPRGPNLVERLFSLYTSSVTIELKGSILRLLSSIAKNDEASAKEIWKLIEEHNLMYELVRQEGFRFDLQPDRPAESTSGQYPATYGFLELLEVLFRRNVNNSLGKEYRRPGVTQYVDFLIDDVIISLTKNAKNFNYEPRDITGEAQRWRMIAKSMKILVIILQHYNINSLPENAVDSVTSSDYYVSSPNLNDEEDLILDFKEVTRQYRLNDGNFNISTEDCVRPKTAGFSIMSLILGKTPLLDTILSLLQECNISALNQNTKDLSSLMTTYSVRILGKLQLDRVRKTSRSDNFSILLGESSCDSLYWRIKTISSCIGLLYEVGIRENRFLELGRSVPLEALQSGKGKIKLVRTVNNRQSILPVLFQYSLADVITSSKLHIISTFLTLQLKPISFPSVPVMVAHLLEFIASRKSHGAFLSSISNESSLNQGCVDVILKRIKGQSDISSLGLGYICDLQPIGADSSLDLFSDINSTVYRPPDLNTAIESAKRGGARETLLNFFLKTLSSNRECLSHVLLGINHNLLKSCRIEKWDVIQASTKIRDPVPNDPCNCLDAIIELLGQDNLIFDNPSLSKICFELLYRLCSSPLTSTIALGYLRKQSHNNGFLPKQIKLMEKLLVQSDDVLDDKPQIQAAARNCCAWLLKIFALELRALSKATSQGPKKEIEVLLELLFGLKSITQTKRSPMVEIFKSTINSIPSDNFEPVKSKVLLNCLNEAACPYFVGQTENELTLFQVVNLDEFQRLANENYNKINRNDYRIAFQTAVFMNVYNEGLAAASHLCQAWSQVLSVSFQSECLNFLLHSDGVGRVEQVIQRITEEIIRPIISEVKSNTMLAMHMAEPIVRSFLTIVDAVRTVTFRCGMLILSEDQHEEILRNLIKSVVVRSNGAFLRDQSSNLYRGLLFNSISRMLHMTDVSKASTLEVITITNIASVIPEKCNETNVRVIEEFLPDLIDILGTDATVSNAIWRFSALSCLGTIFSILGPTRYKSGFNEGVDNHIIGGSHSFLRALDPLVRNGYLQHLLASMSPHSLEDDDLSFDDKKFLFKGVSALCLEISCSQEGVEALVNCGILEIIKSLPPLSIPNSMPSDLAAFGFQDDVVKQEAHLEMEDKLMPLLNLLRTMASTSNSFSVLECCASYMRKNYAVVSYLLRFRILTLRGMEMTEAVVALAIMVASAPSNNSSFSNISTPNQSTEEATSLWDSELGQMSDTLTTDISSLLSNIGN